jgi:molybdate transport system regulatory protein
MNHRQHVRPCIPAAVTVRTKMWLEVEDRFAIGEGGIGLLQAVAEHGSLAAAARQVGWSYRHSWGYVRRAETVLGIRLLATRNGKGANRGTILTDDARALMSKFSGFVGTPGDDVLRRKTSTTPSA